VSQRKQFIDAYLVGDHTMVELCREHGVSRKTAYKWVDRFLSGCELENRSSRPHRSPKAVAQWLEDAIVMARKQKPRWGPRKLRQALLRGNPDAELPSASTFALIFRRNGLITPRRRRRSTPPSSAPLSHATGPNSLWCIDFKGHFAVGGRRCYPLTVTDAFSRYLLACVSVTRPDDKHVRRALEELFERYGLPESIRSDNGPPFATTGLAGLSRLSAWWRKLGIRHERIEPGKPQQNGRHERMHLTLQQETASPPRASLKAQQRAFDRFIREYNDERPHEALQGAVPADYYEPSPRRPPAPMWGRDFTYPEHYETVRLSRTGRLEWNGRSVFVSTALSEELVGLEWNERSSWNVYFGQLLLGDLHRGPRRGLRFAPNKPSVTQVPA
jgi:transposase InsO family protein